MNRKGCSKRGASLICFFWAAQGWPRLSKILSFGYLTHLDLIMNKFSSAINIHVHIMESDQELIDFLLILILSLIIIIANKSLVCTYSVSCTISDCRKIERFGNITVLTPLYPFNVHITLIWLTFTIQTLLVLNVQKREDWKTILSF